MRVHAMGLLAMRDTAHMQALGAGIAGLRSRAAMLKIEVKADWPAGGCLRPSPEELLGHGRTGARASLAAPSGTPC